MNSPSRSSNEPEMFMNDSLQNYELLRPRFACVEFHDACFMNCVQSNFAPAPLELLYM